MRILLTGAGGFLGGAIAARLVERGHSVRSFSRGHYPALEAIGVGHVRGDLGDRDAVIAAAKGCDAVVHTAAKAGVWGDPREYRRANLDGTRNVLAACRRHQVPRLVYTSTPSVVHRAGGTAGGDESLPYTSDPNVSHYVATKAQAEREVLEAGGPGLSVVALRPHQIWGPGDPHFLPRILARARGGRIVLPGGGHELIDTVYIDNAADAHVKALERLAPDAACAGKAYFITNGEPVPMRVMITRILQAGGVERPTVIPLPRRLTHVAGAVLERAFTLAGTEREPPLTRFLAEILTTPHWYDIGAAKRDLDWAPEVSLDEGFARLRASLSAR